jgi:hypothetical protein
MAAPKENKFWLLRSKHGRDKIFETSTILWEEACRYFEWCSKNPWYKIDFKGKTVKRVKIPTERPLTLTGLCLYLGVNTKYFHDFKKTASEDFSEVITRIEETIYTQKFEGATVGAFNANIIARDLGLTDKQEIGIDFDNMTDEALDLILARLTEKANKS